MSYDHYGSPQFQFPHAGDLDSQEHDDNYGPFFSHLVDGVQSGVTWPN